MPNLDLQGAPQALIVGISGPSSSGKTTLARLLQRIFCGVRLDGSSEAETQGQSAQHQNGKLNTFIIHEDDFYFPDDQYVSPFSFPLGFFRYCLPLLISDSIPCIQR